MSNTDPGEERKRGFDAFESGNFAAATASLAGAAANAGDIEAQYRLGAAQSQCGLHAEALATLNTAAQRAPDCAEVQFHLGVALIAAGRIPEATAAFQQAARLNPHHAPTVAWLEWLRRSSTPPAPVFSGGTPGRKPGTGSLAIAPPPTGTPGFGAAGRASGLGVGTRPTAASAPSRSRLSPYALILGPLFLGLAAIGGLIMLGGKELEKEERRFPVPVVLSYAQFLKQKPKEGWFRIKGVALSVGEASWMELEQSPYTISNVHVPVRGLDEDLEKEKIHLLYEVDEYSSNDAKIKETVEKISAYKRAKATAALDEYIDNNPTRIWQERDLVGKLYSGPLHAFASVDSDDQKVINAQRDLAQDCVVMYPYESLTGNANLFFRIGAGLSVGSLGLGALLALVWLLRRWRHSR